MAWFVIFGSVCLGLLVGNMVRVTFRQLEKIDVKTLGSLLSIMAGAGVLAIFQAVAGKGKPLLQEVHCYPVGLFLGYAFTAALEHDKKYK